MINETELKADVKAAKNGTVKPEIKPEVKVNLSAWKMKDQMKWAEAGADPNVASVKVLNEMMAASIVSWPFDGDPTNPDAYPELFPYEWKEAVQAVEAATVRAFQRPEA